MSNEPLAALLLSGLPNLPDGQQVFDRVWGVSPLAAVMALFALVAVAGLVFVFIELRNERKQHRADSLAKDKALASANEQLQTLLTNATTATLGLINKLEVLQAKADTTHLREEVAELSRSMRNGLRALGQKLDIPSERLNVD